VTVTPGTERAEEDVVPSVAEPARRWGITDLPDFPWDTLAGAKDVAAAHSGGIVDLSIGTPVDPTPAVVQDALRANADAPGYPAAIGTPQLRDAVAAFLVRSVGSVPLGREHVLPSIGSKELVAWLPTLLGLGSGDTVVVPELAYPTYAVGAALPGCRLAVTDIPHRPGTFGPDERPAMLWLNSPANPHGRIAGVDELTEIVAWARENGVLVVSDECYQMFGWRGRPVSVLDHRVNGGELGGLLALHSLSKRSNLAGYRAGFAAGDPDVVAALVAVRKHVGMLVPSPVQAAMIAALGDDEHVQVQAHRYRARRELLMPALRAAGFRIDHSDGGLYLWATRGENCRTTVETLARLGILVAPGDFYGRAGAEHVRVALTGTDERIAAAADRLAASGRTAG